MPRSPRLDFPGARHHVMNRTARSEALFTDDRAAGLFLDTLGELPERFGVRVHGYALMPNHYHLMLEVPRGNLSHAMRHLGLVFTQAFNRATGHEGSLFRGRFKNQLVTDDAYWDHLLAYLHLNPVRAKLVRRPEESLWTSHLAYLDEAQCPSWLTTEELLTRFGSAVALSAYIEEVRLKRRNEPEAFDPKRFWVATSTVEAPEPVKPVLRTWNAALRDVASLLGVPVKRLKERGAGSRQNVSWWLTVWWLVRSTGLSQAEIARRLGLSRPRVSQLRARLVELAGKEPDVAAKMAQLEGKL